MAFLNIGKSKTAEAEDEDDVKAQRTSRKLDRTSTRPEWFTGGRSVPGSISVAALRQKGVDPARLVQGPFIKPKKVPRWLLAKPGFAARPKLGVASAEA
jgi:hypothetical protein